MANIGEHLQINSSALLDVRYLRIFEIYLHLIHTCKQIEYIWRTMMIHVEDGKNMAFQMWL